MPEQDPSRFEALKRGVKEAAIGLMGLAGLLAGGVAIAKQLESEPANASNNREASASNLKQDCIEAALATPGKFTSNLQAIMKNPGVIRGRTQVILVRGTFGEMLAGCRAPFNRVATAKVLMEDSKNNNKSFVLTRPAWSNMYSRDGAGSGLLEVSPSSHDESTLYKCTNGKAVTDVDALVKLRLLRDKPIKIPVKGYPGLYRTKRPKVAEKMAARIPVEVTKPC